MHLPTPDAVQVTLTTCALLAMWFGWAKVVGPIVKGIWSWISDLVAVFRGRPARIDRLTGEPVREVPSLVDALVQIRDKQDEHGKALTDLTTVVTQVADQQVTLHEHTGQLADLRLNQAIQAEQIGMLKLAAGERTEMHRESANFFDAVAKRDSDVIDGEAD